MLFFLVDEAQLKPLDTIIQENYQPFYPSEPFRILRFQIRHPVLDLTSLNYSIKFRIHHTEL